MDKSIKVLFVCRGNAFRSILAEAYLRSKQLPNIEVSSAGTVAVQYYEHNSLSYSTDMPPLAEKYNLTDFMKGHYGDQLTQKLLDNADVVVLLNDIVRQEAEQAGLYLPPHRQTWSVVDIGEPGRIAKNRKEELSFKDDVYREIRTQTDILIKSIAQFT